MNFKSFRDPASKTEITDKQVTRHLSEFYLDDINHLMYSGLYKTLLDKNLVIPVARIEDKILSQEYLPFIFSPPELSFSQLKDSAIATLEIQLTALRFGMTLKDATCINIQFHNGLPKLLDITSLELRKEGEPWKAYKQFCEQFLNPLVLASYKSQEVLGLLNLTGLKSSMVSKILPKRTYFNSLLFHVHLHNLSINKFSGKKVKRSISTKGLIGLIENLKGIIEKLKEPKIKTAWGDYKSTDEENKESCVLETLQLLKLNSIIDLGCNKGFYSTICAKSGIRTLAIDNDYNSIETLYKKCKSIKLYNLTPIVADLANPTPPFGWVNKEQDSLITRLDKFDLVIALSLIHHLRISSNVPLNMICNLLKKLGDNTLVEFIPKSDKRVKQLLEYKNDSYIDYTYHSLINNMKPFTIEKTWETASGRTICLFRK